MTGAHRLLERMMDAVTRRFEADRGTLFVVDRARRELVSRVAHLPELREIRIAIGEGVAGEAARAGRPVRAPGGEGGGIARRIDDATGYRTDSVLAVPVLGDGGCPIAVLEILNPRRGDFGEEEARLLSAQAVVVGAVLEAASRDEAPPPPEAVLTGGMVGESAAMRRLRERVLVAAGTDATVLIRGESGTGKGMVAEALHAASRRRRRPFVRVDCAALPESLIENELYGHEEGAFTGAGRASEGRVRVAEGGTLFLDEVGELPLGVQGKLLSLLQDRTYCRVGGVRPCRADMRVVLATHRDLERAVADGKLRLDLYYRMRVVEIVVPPLRERGASDIDLLVDHFVAELGRRHGREALRLDASARAALHARPWPGNVRELEHRIEAAVVLAPGATVTSDLLSELEGPRPPEVPERPPAGAFVTAPRPLAEVERDYVVHVLRLLGGNRSAAARTLGIGRNRLGRKLGA